MEPLPAVYLGLGSNLGDRELHLARARERLRARGFRLERASALYETEPVGGPPQGFFLNQVVEGRTEQPPLELLATCLEIERELGRVRDLRHGPRTIDIDLLLYGTLLLERPELTLPHPRLHQRRFVLQPLAELAPELVHPRLGATIAQLLDGCRDASLVRRLLPQP